MFICPIQIVIIYNETNFQGVVIDEKGDIKIKETAKIKVLFQAVSNLFQQPKKHFTAKTI